MAVASLLASVTLVEASYPSTWILHLMALSGLALIRVAPLTVRFAPVRTAVWVARVAAGSWCAASRP